MFECVCGAFHLFRELCDVQTLGKSCGFTESTKPTQGLESDFV
jgi:hypothetical protein